MADTLRSWANRVTGGRVEPPRRRAEPLRVLLVHAHPLRDSFSAALARAAQIGLERAGHSVDVLELSGADGGFQPALTADELRAYGSDRPAPAADVRPVIERLKRAEALVFVYPTWWSNVPAVLKGFVDRTFIPGVAFHPPKPGSTHIEPGLTNVRKVAAVTTYGAERHLVALSGDNGRGMITRCLLPLFAPDCPVLWLGLFDVESSAQRRAAFLERVESAFADF